MQAGEEGGVVTIVAGDEGLQHAIRKNELAIGRIVRSWIIGNWLWLLGLQLVVVLFEQNGPLEIGLLASFALGLGLLEEFEGAFELAGDALLVEGEIGQRFDVHFKGPGGGTGGDGAIVSGFDVVLLALDGVEGEQGLLVGGDAV